MSWNARNRTEYETGTLTIVVIDLRALIRDCLANSLRTMNEGWVIWTFAGVDEWHSVQSSFRSAVIVLYAQDRQANEIERDLAQLAQGEPCFPTLVMSDAEDVELVRLAFSRGARGYIPTSMSLSVAVEAMRLVDAGGTFVPPSILQHANGAAIKESNSNSGHFTERQAAVLQALRQGKANKLIAHELNMREGTVKVHVRNIMRKLNARNCTEVAIWASSRTAH